MKFSTASLLGLVFLLAVCSAKPAEEEYADYEQEQEASSPKPVVPPARHSPLIGRRNPLSSRSPPGKTTSTTTTTPAPKEENVAAEQAVEEEVQAETTSTTESTKKIKSGIVRPFRSNDDLLAALKRRREQASNLKHQAKLAAASENEESSASHSAQPEKTKSSKLSGRRRFNSKNDNKVKETVAESTNEEAPASPAPTRTSRRFSPRS